MDSLDFLGPQKALHSTGSFTGYRPLQDLGSDYLTATTTTREPLCANKEGWGPISPHRYDFTPCFIDVWILIVAIFGLVLGLGAVWYLKKKKQVMGTEKNFHFWLKQVCLGFTLCLSVGSKSILLIVARILDSRRPCRHSSCYPAHRPDTQLRRRCPSRFPSLDHGLRDPLPWRHFLRSVGRAFAHTIFERCRSVLLAVPGYCLGYQASIPDLPTNICQEPSLFRVILCWIWP